MALTREQQETLIRTDRGTAMGELFRRYWIPALLPEELPRPDCDPVRVRLLGEDLIAFRDSEGRHGLIDEFCAHRGVSLFFGRNEDCGLRCAYHGWKYDVEGRCVDMPSEPPDSMFKEKVTIAAYPTFEAGGMIWTSMGPPDKKPPVPYYEWLRVPETHRFVSKTLENCNYLQGLEGGLDTAHSSFAHNERLNDPTWIRNRDTHPRLEVDRTDYGFNYASTRDLGEVHSGQYSGYVWPMGPFYAAFHALGLSAWVVLCLIAAQFIPPCFRSRCSASVSRSPPPVGATCSRRRWIRKTSNNTPGC